MRHLREWLNEPFNVFLVLISIVANVLQIAATFPPAVSLLLLFSTLLLILAISVTRELRRARRQLKGASRNLAEQYGFLREFLESVGVSRLRDPLTKDNTLHVTEYEYYIKIRDDDMGLLKCIKGRNVSKGIVDGITMKFFGGSSKDLDDLPIRYRATTNVTTILKPTTVKDVERTKWLRLPFPQVLQSGGDFSLEFELWWPGSIRQGTDSVIFSDSLDHLRGIDLMRVIIEFDAVVSLIVAYSLNIDTNSFDIEESQPILERSGNRQYPVKYKWEKQNPTTDRIYMIVFSREVKSKSRQKQFDTKW
jgi:hypothetical protein